MENPEEILHSLEEFAKLRPKDIPRELEEYLCFVAKTGDPVYQWSSIKSLFREKLINVITEFYESCPSVEIPPCPNVEMFNYESMKSFILEKLDTFAAAPFTVQRICELLTTPRKEYNRIDKYMRALEKNILVVSTVEPRDRRAGAAANNHENVGDGVVNGLEVEHHVAGNDAHPLNNEEMEDVYAWTKMSHQEAAGPASGYQGNSENGLVVEAQTSHANNEQPSQTFTTEPQPSPSEQQPTCSSLPETTTLSCSSSTSSSSTAAEPQPYVSIEAVVVSDSCSRQETPAEAENVSVTITAIPAADIQKRRSSTEPVISSDDSSVAQASTSSKPDEPADLQIETTPEETATLPTASDKIAEKPADSTSVCTQEVTAEAAPQESAATSVEEEDNKETLTTETAATTTTPQKIDVEEQEEEKTCESTTEEVAVEVSSTEKVVDNETPVVAAEEKENEVEAAIITSSEEVTNEATTSEDKVEKQQETTDASESDKIVEADTPTTIQESDSVSELPTSAPPAVAADDESTPMEVDERVEEPETTAENPETSTSS